VITRLTAALVAPLIPAMALALPPTAHADMPWTAAARSISAGHVITKTRAPTQAAAEQDALQDCQNQYPDCQLVGSTQQCIYVSTVNGQPAAGYGPSRAAAAQDFATRWNVIEQVSADGAYCAWDP
jgi:hypothetical protein